MHSNTRSFQFVFAMTPGAFPPNPEWHWPDDIHAPPVHPENRRRRDGGADNTQDSQSTSSSTATPKPEKSYPSRTCRICLEVVPPTYHPPPINLPEILQSPPHVTYESSDPELGRLIRPCKCKGSSRYVHEGCLQSWRHADPAYGKRNYWQCPTCGFRYRLERMRWGRWISSSATQIVLTVVILVLAMFLLGFVADPIINLYVDPYYTVSSGQLLQRNKVVLRDEESSWIEHFVKGLASLGVLSFVKILFALSPWQWWNLRSSGLISGGGRTGPNGRDRIASISWVVVLIGVGTFLWVW